MGTGEWIAAGVLLLNGIVAALYLIIGLLREARKDHDDEDEGDRKRILISFFVMLLFPVAGIIFFSLSALLNRIVFRKDVDLSDVIFSKERVKSLAKGDDEAERNMVPIEEALAVSDRESLRTLMLNVLKGDVSESLHSISEALYSEDSETAHYAASVLRDELNDYRTNTDKLYEEMRKAEEMSPDDVVEMADALLSYMNAFLSQDVFMKMEQEFYVKKMADVAETLHRISPSDLQCAHFEWVTRLLTSIRDFDAAAVWCERGMQLYPHELSSYTAYLKLYFATGNREAFFATLDDLKSSDIVMDKETLELVRTFS